MGNSQKMSGQCIIFSAPSGAGKTTIVHALLKRMNGLAFSISACSRNPRGDEKHGEDYYFLGIDEFKEKIEEGAFIEWEEVYTNHFYGTLKSEVDRLWAENKVVLFDVDVYGGINLKKYFGASALSLFIKPPSIEVLEKRLHKRQTDSEDKIQLRLKKAKEEMSNSEFFDKVVVNHDLEPTIQEIENIVKEYIK